MKIAGHTLGTPDHDLAGALRLFRDAGLDAAEVIYQSDYPAAITPADERSAHRAAEAARNEGVPIIALTPYTTAINSLDTASWNEAIGDLRACIAAAHIVGATRVRIYAGSWHPGDQDWDAHWSRLREALQVLAQDAADAGVVLCVENHFGTMTQTAANTARLVREVGAPSVGVLYDQANLTFTHDEDWREAFAVQGDLISHVHVKDLVFKDPNAPFRASDTARVKAEERAVSSRVIGDGVLPWGEIIAELVGRGYDDALTVEYEYRWHPQDLPAPEIGFAQAATTLRSLLGGVEVAR